MPSIYCTMPGTTPHCLLKIEGNVNSLGTRSLAYIHTFNSSRFNDRGNSGQGHHRRVLPYMPVL